MKVLKSFFQNTTVIDVLAILFPLLLMLVLIIKFSVNVPVTDQYELVDIFQKIDNGSVSFNDFWQQHNEHRIFFPNLILVGLGLISHWNILVEVYVSFVIACVGFTAIFMLIRRHVQPVAIRFIALLFSSLFFFSPVQWENWLWGWQLEWFLAVACILWTINLLDLYTNVEKLRKRVLAVPMLTAFVATFSLGSGIFAWVIGGLIILVKKPKWKFLYVWIGGFVLSAAIYYAGLHASTPPNNVPASAILHSVELFNTYIKTFLAYVGRPITNDPQAATLVGLYILFLFAALTLALFMLKSVRIYIAPIALGLLGIGIGVVTIAGRIGFGIGSGMSSRYTAYSSLILISMVIMCALLLSKLIPYIKTSKTNKKRVNAITKSLLPVLLILILMPSAAYSWYNGLHGIRERSKLYHYIAACTREAKPDHACLYEVYFPDTVKAKNMIDYLKEKGYGGY